MPRDGRGQRADPDMPHRSKSQTLLLAVMLSSETPNDCSSGSKVDSPVAQPLRSAAERPLRNALSQRQSYGITTWSRNTFDTPDCSRVTVHRVDAVFGKLRGSGTFFGGNVQRRTRKSSPKNEPDPHL